LRIVSAVQALSRWLSRTDEVRTVPGAVYSGSTWLRTAKLLGQATVALTFWSADDRFLGAVESAPAPANGDWAQATVSGTAPAGAVSVRLEIRLSGSGTLWADDAAVTASGA
jgi:hypothetical protein